MRIPWAIALGAALLALTGCSSPNQAVKRAEPAELKIVKAPELFRVNLDTSKGPVIIEVHRDWAPFGADQFYSLVNSGFYSDVRFYRVVRDFVAQFGINGDPAMNRLWADSRIPDDPVKQSNVKGTLTFAASGPSTRATNLFINLADNVKLDKQGFAPIGTVVSGMETVERFYFLYGEMPSMGGRGPDPTEIEKQGNDYLAADFSRLDFIRKATVQ